MGEAGEVGARVGDVAAALRTGRRELDRLFATSVPGEIPRGFARGTALVATGTVLGHMVARAMRPLWLGKHFDSLQSRLRNVVTPGRLGAFVARVHEGPSRLDGRPAIILDYSGTSFTARLVRDELRQVGPRDYLGVVFVAGRRAPVHFWLQVEEAEGPTRDVAEFELEQRPRAWLDEAPVQIHRAVHVPAPPGRVFAVLADSEHWPTWFGAIRRVAADNDTYGVGALRTVWARAWRVQERFERWDEGAGMTLSLVRCNRPGLRAMVEDWSLSSEGPGSRLDIHIGVEPARGIPHVVARTVVARATEGAVGIVDAVGRSGAD